MGKKPDNTGIVEALKQVPANQLSGRDARIAAGLALIREHGRSILSSAKEVGVPYSTLQRYHAGLSSLGHETRVRAHEDALLEQSMEIAQIGADIIKDRLLDPEHDWRDADLIKAHQVGLDGVAKRRRWASADGNEEGPSGISALAKILQGHDVVLSKRPPDADAIDVTPPEDEGGEP